MDWPTLKIKLWALVKEYRYAVIILVIGLILMLMPSGGKDKVEEPTPGLAQGQTEPLEERLGEVLSAVQGAGMVKILLTEALGGRTVYQTDTQERTDALTEDTVSLTVASTNTKAVMLYKELGFIPTGVVSVWYAV